MSTWLEKQKAALTPWARYIVNKKADAIIKDNRRRRKIKAKKRATKSKKKNK